MILNQSILNQRRKKSFFLMVLKVNSLNKFLIMKKRRLRLIILLTHFHSYFNYQNVDLLVIYSRTITIHLQTEEKNHNVTKT